MSSPAITPPTPSQSTTSPSPAAAALAQLEPRPLPDNFVSAQPGGGFAYSLELAWGRWRRAWLKRVRPRYTKRMADLRQGNADGAPHEVLDPRDLKYCRNRCSAEWREADDPFRWRERIPLARWGLAEVQVMGWPLLALTVAVAWFNLYAAIAPALLLIFVVSFFRDPPRRVPTTAGLIVSPADGTIAEIARLEYDPFIEGPAVRVGIFLSVFNVHLNRAPAAARVIELRYRRGEFRNALRADSVERNENTFIGLQEVAPPYRRLVVRQIAGAIARRIVCALRPGEAIARGAKIGMIKFGSRTELIVPECAGLQIAVRQGEKVRAGSTIIARYADAPASAGEAS